MGATGTTDRRGFIRHPVEIPIEVQVEAAPSVEAHVAGDVGGGGLRFRASHRYARGARVQVRIDVVEPAFEAPGCVAWCDPRDDHDGFEIGVEFLDANDRFTARMIEQVCHIEKFRRDAQAAGRALSPQEAAHEWVRRFASDFPGA